MSTAHTEPEIANDAAGIDEPGSDAPVPVRRRDRVRAAVERRPRVAWALRNVLPVLLILTFCVGVVSYHVQAYPRLSPLDEQAHADYLLKVRQGHILQPGERVGKELMAEANCRGFDSPYVPPPCLADPDDYRAEDFVFGGVNAAAGHTPVYYAITALIATPISWLPQLESFLTAGRIAGGIWLGAALSVLWFVFRGMGVPILSRVALTGLLTVAPMIIHQSSTVNPDAASLLAGALVLLALTRVRPGPWLLFVISYAAVSPKATNVIAVIAGALVVLTMREFSKLQRLARVGAMAAGAMLMPVTWSIVSAFRALPAPPSQLPTDEFSWAYVWMHMRQFVPPMQQAAFPSFFTNDQVLLNTTTFTDILLLSSVVGAALFLRVGSRARAIGAATLLLMVIGPWIIIALISSRDGVLIIIPPRYGLSLVPLMLIGFASMRFSRPAQLALFALAGVAVVNTLHLISGSTYTTIG